VQGKNTGLVNPKIRKNNKICLTLKNAGSSTTALTPEDEERYAKNKKYPFYHYKNEYFTG
jgi:hypothetical protein